LIEKKNEENRKSYEEVLKGRNRGQSESKKIIEDLQEDHPCSSHKEASIMIMINQGKNSEGLRQKEDHSLQGMQIYLMVIVFIVLTLDIRLLIADIIK
jgi:hypothetical protein